MFSLAGFTNNSYRILYGDTFWLHTATFFDVWHSNHTSFCFHSTFPMCPHWEQYQHACWLYTLHVACYLSCHFVRCSSRHINVNCREHAFLVIIWLLQKKNTWCENGISASSCLTSNTPPSQITHLSRETWDMITTQCLWNAEINIITRILKQNTWQAHERERILSGLIPR